MNVCFVDNGRIVDHHSLNLLLIMYENALLMLLALIYWKRLSEIIRQRYLPKLVSMEN